MKYRKIVQLLLVLGVGGLFGCGGGGGNSTPPPVVPKATVSGSVQFPALTSLVAKTVAATVQDAQVSVQAYTLDGTPVGSPVTPTYDDQATGASDFTKRVYSYSIPNLTPGVDYVIKAKRTDTAGKSQVLRKLIEKKDVVEGTVAQQKIDSVSTTAVIVASQKLAPTTSPATFVLGESASALQGKTVSELSTAIATQVAPSALEKTIQAAIQPVKDAIQANDYSNLAAAAAQLINTLNLVMASVASNVDPNALISGNTTTPVVLPSDKPVQLLNVSGGVVSAPTAVTTVSTATISTAATSSATAYVPPRLKLDIGTDTSGIYGLSVDLSIPADIQLASDATGMPDMTRIVAASGLPAKTYFDAQFISSGTLRVIIVAPTPLPSGTLLSITFDRSPGKTVTANNIAVVDNSLKATSQSGGSFGGSFQFLKTATSTGL